LLPLLPLPVLPPPQAKFNPKEPNNATAGAAAKIIRFLLCSEPKTTGPPNKTIRDGQTA